MATYTYFKKSGKYYTEGKGENIPLGSFSTDRDSIMRLNFGKMPGLSGKASEFYIVITDDDESYPRLLMPEA